MTESKAEKKSCSCGCCGKKKSIWLRILGILCLIAVIGLTLTVFCLGGMVKTAVQTVGSKVTGCQITVKSINVSILRGRVEIEDFVVGNPEGFKTESAFKFSKVLVDLEPKTLLTDKIIISEVQVIGPEFTYEVMPLKLTSNIGAIEDNVNSFLPASKDDEKKAEPKEEEEKEGKKVQINHVLVQDGEIKFSATFAGGHALPVPLPKIEMNDIGKEEDTTCLEAFASIFSKTCSSVVSGAGSAAKGVGNAVSGAGKAIMGLFGGKSDTEKAAETK